MADIFANVLRELQRSGSVSEAQWPPDAESPVSIGLTRDGDGMLRLAPGESLLDVTAIAALSGVPVSSFTHVLSTGSTNADLLAEGRLASIHRRIHLAEHQGAGRGRRGRAWISPLTRCIAMSFGLETSQPPARVQGLSLVAGLSVCTVLRRAGGLRCGVKWPNDVLDSGRKLCGILVEHQFADGCSQYVVGIGINMGLTQAEQEAVNQPVANAVDAGVTSPRSTLVADLVVQLHRDFEQLETQGFAAFQSAFTNLHILQGVEVTVRDGGRESHSGRVVGVDRDGALIIESGAGHSRYIGGEVTVRRLSE